MAKLKLSGIGIVDMSGKIGTDVVARNTAGLYIREFVPPTDPDTIYQQAQRERVSAVSGQWSLLSQEQMKSWNDAAESGYWDWPVRFMNSFRPTGQQLFVRVNLNAYDYSFPILTPPPLRSFNENSIPRLNSFTCDTEDGIVAEFSSVSMQANTVLQLSITGGLSPGVFRPRPNLFKLCLDVPAAEFSTSINLDDEFNARHGTLEPSTKVFLRTFLLDALTGRKMIIEQASALTTGEAPPEGLIDPDGNEYTTVVIGSQEWAVENWKSTKYANGDAIPNVTDGSTWSGLSSGAYCWYNNDIGNKPTYGALYNWYAMSGLAPDGWRVATATDFNTLASTLGGASVAGGKMKETGTTYWNSPNTGADNSSGFSARGAGGRFSGSFDFLLSFGSFWTSTEIDPSTGGMFTLSNSSAELITNNNNKGVGGSVRMVRDV